MDDDNAEADGDRDEGGDYSDYDDDERPPPSSADVPPSRTVVQHLIRAQQNSKGDGGGGGKAKDIDYTSTPLFDIVAGVVGNYFGIEMCMRLAGGGSTQGNESINSRLHRRTGLKGALIHPTVTMGSRLCYAALEANVGVGAATLSVLGQLGVAEALSEATLWRERVLAIDEKALADREHRAHKDIRHQRAINKKMKRHKARGSSSAAPESYESTAFLLDDDKNAMDEDAAPTSAARGRGRGRGRGGAHRRGAK